MIFCLNRILCIGSLANGGCPMPSTSSVILTYFGSNVLFSQMRDELHGGLHVPSYEKRELSLQKNSSEAAFLKRGHRT